MALESLQKRVEQVDAKQMKIYLALIVLAFTAITGVISYFYYSSIQTANQQIDELNDNRQEIQLILTKARQLEQQRKEVDKILSEEEDFKIGGYFEKLITTLNIANKKTSSTVTTTQKDNNYLESTLNVKFDNMSMKELTELLHEIEEKVRIYVKSLEITKAKKGEPAIDVNLTIATLLPKTAGTT